MAGHARYTCRGGDACLYVTGNAVDIARVAAIAHAAGARL